MTYWPILTKQTRLLVVVTEDFFTRLIANPLTVLFNSYRSSLLKYTFQYESIDTRHVSLAGPRIRFQLRFRFDPIRIYIWNSREIDLFFFFFFFSSLNDLVKSTSERQVQTREEKKKIRWKYHRKINAYFSNKIFFTYKFREKIIKE